uniref:Ig-like domain-containing protein n=1 Tax=Vombatus ursinus TaxID=29139 RepID=A0A4X2L9Y5_VOMUR
MIFRLNEIFILTILQAVPAAPKLFPLSSCWSSQMSDAPVAVGCLAKDFLPESINFSWSYQNQSAVSATDLKIFPTLMSGSTYTATSQVTLPANDVFEGQDSYLVCKTRHTKGNKEVRVPLPEHKTGSGCTCCTCPACEVGGPSVLLFPPNPKDTLTLSRIPKITCKVIDEKLNNGTFQVVSALPVAHQDWLNGVVYTCRVDNKELPFPEKKTISHPKGDKKKPEVYVFAPHIEELKHKDTVSLTCLVNNFFPREVVVEWRCNNQDCEENYSTTPTIKENDTFFVYSKLTVRKSKWQENNSYTCTVLHEALPNQHTERTVSASPELIPDENCAETKDGELDGLWTTISIFITLFLLSVCYSATVTLFKVKWIFSSVMELKQPMIPDYRNMMGQGA